ncbi:MAG: hypothetical protein HFH93_13275 [Lachnospiraceae bacterium]|nr:hypothetical protein [Lachnospiraceae bacterium]
MTEETKRLDLAREVMGVARDDIRMHLRFFAPAPCPRGTGGSTAGNRCPIF